MSARILPAAAVVFPVLFLSTAAPAATSPVVERMAHFNIVATIDGLPTRYPIHTLANRDRVFYSDDPLAFHTTANEQFRGSRALAGIDDGAGVWDVSANILEDGISFRFAIDPPELPGEERTAFVPFPEIWDEPLSVHGTSLDGEGNLVVEDPRGPWHWPDVVLLDETLTWTFYPDTGPPEERSRHYFARLDSFGWFKSAHYMDQSALDRTLAGWGQVIDGELMDQGDLDQVLTHWGTIMRPVGSELGAAAVPEPPGWAMVLLIVVGWIVWPTFYRLVNYRRWL